MKLKRKLPTSTPINNLNLIAEPGRKQKPKLRKNHLFPICFCHFSSIFPPSRPPICVALLPRLSHRFYHQKLSGLPCNTKNTSSLSSLPAKQGCSSFCFLERCPIINPTTISSQHFQAMVATLNQRLRSFYVE